MIWAKIRDRAIDPGIILLIPAICIFPFMRPLSLAAMVYGIVALICLCGRLCQNLLETAVLTVVISVILAILIPAVQHAREIALTKQAERAANHKEYEGLTAHPKYSAGR